jgi:hypothetical protein
MSQERHRNDEGSKRKRRKRNYSDGSPGFTVGHQEQFALGVDTADVSSVTDRDAISRTFNRVPLDGDQTSQDAKHREQSVELGRDDIRVFTNEFVTTLFSFF